LGWAPAGNYFASLPVFCDFQNGFILGIISKPRELLIIEVAVFLLVAQALVINRLAGLPYPIWNAPASVRPSD
jgi:hypothetical protein